MKATTAMQPERASAWVPAAIVGAVVVIAVGLAAWLFLDAGLRHATPPLEQASRTGAAAVGQAVAGQFSHALNLGIPFDKLPGVDPYLKRIADNSPQVDGLAIIDSAGKTLFTTGGDIAGESFPISGNGVQATLMVEMESPLIDQAVLQVRVALAIAALLAGAVTGGLVACFVAFHLRPAQGRLLDDMERVAKGDFSAHFVGEDRGPLFSASRALSRNIERVKAARRGMVEAVATIRAIDFDGSLGRRVDAILKPIDSRYAFADAGEDRDGFAEVASRSGVWRVALMLGLYAAAFPYVANFAIDRESDVVPLPWLPVLPLLAELAAVFAGTMLGRTRAGSSGALLALAGFLLAAALGATYWCRTYDVFVMLRACAGLAGGFIAAALLLHRHIDLPPRSLATPLIFSALFAAPLASGLYAEAIGRRSGFLVLGIAMLVATPFLAAGSGEAGKPLGPSRTSPAPADLLLGLATIPAAAMVLVGLPAGIGFDNYLVGTGAAAVLAIAALAAPALSPLACGTALLLAAVALFDPLSNMVVSTVIACAALGFAAGGAIRAFCGAASRPWLALGFAAAAGLVIAGTTAQSGVPFAAVIVALALAVAAGHFLGRRPAETAPA
ncbi:hypothetical protein [Mesorhizobium sp. IMUNJ 23232]|uniref:hypothetical protein n=1 Tax=Mesorhizobium sp. IMUNJ 23232 TaxID=3376064 RepID=UPI0037B91F99